MLELEPFKGYFKRNNPSYEEESRAFRKALNDYIEEPSQENASIILSFDENEWGGFINKFGKDGTILLLKAAHVAVEAVALGFQEIIDKCEK